MVDDEEEDDDEQEDDEQENNDEQEDDDEDEDEEEDDDSEGLTPAFYFVNDIVVKIAEKEEKKGTQSLREEQLCRRLGHGPCHRGYLFLELSTCEWIPASSGGFGDAFVTTITPLKCEY